MKSNFVLMCHLLHHADTASQNHLCKIVSDALSGSYNHLSLSSIYSHSIRRCTFTHSSMIPHGSKILNRLENSTRTSCSKLSLWPNRLTGNLSMQPIVSKSSSFHLGLLCGINPPRRGKAYHNSLSGGMMDFQNGNLVLVTLSPVPNLGDLWWPF